MTSPSPEFIGVLLDSGNEFVVDSAGITQAPSISKKFPAGCRVRARNADKLYPKFDEMAKTLCLGKFVINSKPASGICATVLGSCIELEHML